MISRKRRERRDYREEGEKEEAERGEDTADLGWRRRTRVAEPSPVWLHRGTQCYLARDPRESLACD